MDRRDSIRIHLDWWEQCRTCSFWKGRRIHDPRKHGPREPSDPGAVCRNSQSPLYGQKTFWEGRCPKWDSFDQDVALGLLELREGKVTQEMMDLDYLERVLATS